MKPQGAINARCMQHPAPRFAYNALRIVGHTADSDLISRIIAVSFMAVVLSVAFVCQATRLVTTNFELVIVIDIVPSIMVLAIVLIYLPIAYGNRKKYDQMTALLMVNEDQKRTKEEERIKQKDFIRQLKTVPFLRTFSVVLFLGTIVILIPSLLPPFLDRILTLNESRQRSLPFEGEYFVDTEKYFYEILLFQYINMLVISFIGASSELIFLMGIIYLCGMFKILTLKLENIMNDENGVKQEWVCQSKEFISRINVFVETHRIILKFIEILNVCGEKLIVLALLGTLLVISLSLVEVMNPNLITLKSVLLALCSVTQFALLCSAGQLLLNAGEQLLQDVYNCSWYCCPPSIQKLFILIIMEASKPCGIYAMNFFLLSYQNFSAVIQASVSYAMVFKQFDN